MTLIHAFQLQRNVLISRNGNALITDFGFAVIAGANPNNYESYPVHAGGMIQCTAPELIDPAEDDDSNNRQTRQSDVWAFGCVCYQVKCSF